MAEKIRITAGPVSVEAELNDTQTARAISNDLPIKAHGSRWGDEIYFSISTSGQLENGNDLVEVGDLAFWPPGNAFCIFWGPTPASHGSEPRAASAVTVIGRITGDASAFSQVSSGTEVTIERAD